MKICNIPRKATDVMVTKMLQRKIKDLKYEKIIVEMDNKSSLNKGIAWVSSKDIFTLNQLIKLHYHVSYNRNSFFIFIFIQIYASYKLTTYIQGYAYDSLEDIEDSK